MRMSRRGLLPWACLLGSLLAAEAAIRLAGVPDYLLPMPSAVLREIVTQMPRFLPHLRVTMTEAILGFLGGNVAAILFGFLFSQWRLLREGGYPLIVALQAVPIVAVAPFIMIWFGPGLAGKAIMAGLLCYFPATVIATDGFSRVNREALNFMLSLGASRWQVFSALRLPSAIPSILSALEVSATLCTVGAVVAELAGSSEGIGYLVVRASYEFRTVTLFAVLSVTSCSTLVLFKAVQALGRRYGRRFSFSFAVSSD